MARYRTAFRKLVPSWLSEGENGDVLHSLGVIKDAFVERMRQALYAGFPSYAPPSALPYLGRDRKVVRGINEPEASYRARLLTWLDDHLVRGNAYSLTAALAAYCGPGVRIRVVNRRGNWYTRERDGSFTYKLNQGNWDWDGVPATPRWARFWVIIYPTADGLPWAPSGNWGDPNLWESAPGVQDHWWGNPGKTIGTTATADEVASVRAIIRAWKSPGRCEWIIVAFDDASFDPDDPNQPTPNPAEWGNWGRDDGTGHYVAARLASARYWRGPSSEIIT